MAQDITKTGKQNYRQLQEQNAKEQSGTPDNGNNEFTLRGSIANFRQRAASEAANEIAAEGTPRVVKSPIFQRTGGEDYVGNSMWDEDLYYGNNLEDPNNTSFDNTRGENQWGIAQLGAGIGKGIALAGTTFVDGLVGLGYGLITGGGKAINEFNDENKRVYVDLSGTVLYLFLYLYVNLWYGYQYAIFYGSKPFLSLEGSKDRVQVLRSE